MILVIDTKPSEPKTLIELKARKNIKPAAPPQSLTARVNEILSGRDPDAEPAGMGAGGAASAAGVLNAVDEDGEGEEEADVPRDFDYYSAGEDEEG